MTLGADPAELTPSRALDLGADLRDVLVRGEQLFVSRFRSAELLVLNKDGALQETRKFAVDFAIDPDAALLVVIAPGNFGDQSQLQVIPLHWFDHSTQAAPDESSAPNPTPAQVEGRDIAPCPPAEQLSDPIGQATALTFTSPCLVAVQEREPAAISFYDLRTRAERRASSWAEPRASTPVTRSSTCVPVQASRARRATQRPATTGTFGPSRASGRAARSHCGRTARH